MCAHQGLDTEMKRYQTRTMFGFTFSKVLLYLPKAKKFDCLGFRGQKIGGGRSASFILFFFFFFTYPCRSTAS